MAPAKHAAAADPSATVVAKAKYRVTYNFKDPGTAQFREVVVYRHVGESIVCGQVNAKNAMGAYVGFSPFVYQANTDKGTVRREDDDSIFDLLSSVTCNNASSTEVATTTTTATGDGKPTPLPVGYKQAASLKYADDDTISAEAQELLRQATGSDTATVTLDDGTKVVLSPRLLVSLAAPTQQGERYLVVLTGDNGECHGCSGVISTAHVEKLTAGGATGGVDSSSPVEFGSWGKPAQVQVYLRFGSDIPLLRASYDSMNGGCSESSGQLFRVGVAGLSPVAKVYSKDGGCDR